MSRSKNKNRYFASRPDKNVKQRYTKEELKCVPEIYKPYAKPIESIAKYARALEVQPIDLFEVWTDEEWEKVRTWRG